MVYTQLDSNSLQQGRHIGRKAWREIERRVAWALGVGFDGRYYRYKEYRYDLGSDAFNYARLDRARPTYLSAPPGPLPWKKPEGPTDKERQMMAEFRITFDGKYYRFDSYRYEHIADAVQYAGQRQGA